MHAMTPTVDITNFQLSTEHFLEKCFWPLPKISKKEEIIMRRKFATTKNTSTIELVKRGVFRIKVGPAGDIKKEKIAEYDSITRHR